MAIQSSKKIYFSNKTFKHHIITLLWRIFNVFTV
jgi:hypothetical protein